MDDNRTPLVSIGMPIYNSEKYLSQALDSLLTQDYPNFELIISDNSSTDRSEDICLQYMKKNKRIAYFRNDANLGAGYNFKNAFEHANGDFFMWAGSHDLWISDYISRLVNVLQTNPQIALAYTEMCFIDERGNDCNTELYHLDTRGMPILERIQIVIKTLSFCNLFYGLYRTSIIKKCRQGINSLGADHVLLMEISLFGEIAEVPGKGFLRRAPVMYQNDTKRIETTLLRLDPAYKNRHNVRAWWEMGWQHILGIWLAPISNTLKIPLMFVAGKTFYSRFKDVLHHEIFHPLFPKNTATKSEVPDW